MKIWIAGAIAVIAVFAGVHYAHRPAGDAVATPALAPVARKEGTRAAPAAPAVPLTARSKVDAAALPTSTDPRVAALLVAPDSELVEFVIGENGKVISEIDKDPGSPGYGRPLREYSYAGDRVALVSAYRYRGGRVQATRTMILYKPDGGVDRIRESTDDTPMTR